MAYGRKRARSRRFVKRRPVKRRRTGWGGYLKTGMSLARQVWKLKGLVNSEMYKFDQPGASMTPLLGGDSYLLCGVGQGDGDGNRTGNSIFVRSLNIKGFIQRNASGDTSQIVRLSVIMDSQQVADTVPTFSTIYEGNGIQSHLNSDTAGRFKVLYNHVFTVDNLTRAVIPFEINLPMRHHVRYNGTSGADIQRGGLYLVGVSTQGTANGPTISFDSRLSYHDN